MNEKTASLRLDEILVRDGLVTEEQVKEVLQYQKENGGRIGSLLMSHGFVDETGLVKALSKQCGCDGVVLSDLEIPDIVIRFVPRNIANARKVLPFDYDPESDTLKVACEEPQDKNLVDELRFILRGKQVKLFIAAESSLKDAIKRYYGDPNGGSGGEAAPGADQAHSAEIAAERGSILLVTDEEDHGESLKNILEKHNYRVVTTDSADDAIDAIDGHEFHTVFIKDTVPGDYIDLIDRLRKISPRTRVRYYEHGAKLLLEDDTASMQDELLVRNLDLFTSLLASREKTEANHTATVGQYVDKLCRRIGLPDKDRMVITSAAYLHDLAYYYYGGSAEMPDNPRAIVDKNAKLLDSLNFSPLVVAVVQSMYINLRKKYTRRLPIEILGGNIVTMVDIFCDTIPDNEPISLDKFETIKTKFHDLTGKLFLGEVVDAFIDMIQDEMLAEAPDEKFGQVMIFATDTERLGTMKQRLRREGFRALTHRSVDSFVNLYQRGTPDMMVIVGRGDIDDTTAIITDITRRGVQLDKVPTFLLVDSSVATQATALLENGIEDVIPFDENMNLLLIKMKKMRSRIEAEATERRKIESDSGSYGSLENMNLIDLLQALGPSRKTVRMIVAGQGGELTMFLRQGNIIFAQCREKSGAEAVYEAMAWTRGTWRIEHVGEDLLPEPNNEFSNESILMEGCRLIDERLMNETGDISTQKIEHVP